MLVSRRALGKTECHVFCFRRKNHIFDIFRVCLHASW